MEEEPVWENFDGETERRVVEQWANDLGHVDVLQLRSYDDPQDTWYVIWTGDDLKVLDADSDEAAASFVWTWLQDDMRRVE
jgi:hypothetical protein